MPRMTSIVTRESKRMLPITMDEAAALPVRSVYQSAPKRLKQQKGKRKRPELHWSQRSFNNTFHEGGKDIVRMKCLFASPSASGFVDTLTKPIKTA